MKHVICVHTAMALVEPLTKIFQELIPEVTVNHIADSSLIKEVIANNQVTAAVRRRLLSYSKSNVGLPCRSRVCRCTSQAPAL
ncbi:MAG: hypothetical protein IIT76_10480 [Prevotella sp.]|nr:hypothetical protein [Prevotella sp.]